MEPDVKQLSGQDPPKEVELEDAEEGELESLVRGGRDDGIMDMMDMMDMIPSGEHTKRNGKWLLK